tara:strand:+ start:656 stop:931 length:276 start_codon:yes stop_codon:yes gene_type:complete
MIENVWIAFLSGMIIGSMFGILCFSIVLINRDNKLKDEIGDAESRINDLELQRKLLKGEIFRLTKNYKPRKPQPRLKRNLNKNQKKNNRKK